jgi:hypothetical protein
LLLVVLLFVAAAAEALSSQAGLRFVVQGTVFHEQFGRPSRKEMHPFTARVEGSSWSISTTEDSRDNLELLAVGNEDGVFVMLDTSKLRKMREAQGFPVGYA